MSRSILFVCGEPMGERMASPALRTLELASALSRRGIRVTIAGPRAAGDPVLPQGVHLQSLAGADLGALARDHDRVVVGAGLLSRFPALTRAPVPLAVDLYDPVPLEAAELYRDAAPVTRRAVLAEARENLRLELRRADLVLCASERQAHLWEGAMMMLGTSTPILRVPFGVPDSAPPVDAAPVLRGVVPGITSTDRVLLWAGGLHDWLDPELVVAAVGRLAADHPDLRLVFMGTASPNAALQGHGAGGRARQAAAAAGLLGVTVFFREGWVPYGQRGAYLLEADIGVSAHHHSAEARYSWRTRLLDYLWAGLPVVCTGGDPLGDMLGARGAGMVSTPGDVAGFASCLRSLLEDPGLAAGCRAAGAALAAELRWSSVVAPLADWVGAPSAPPRRAPPGLPTALWWMLATKAAVTLREDGLSALRRRADRFRDRV